MLKLLGLLLRFFSFLFHVPLALFLLALGLFALIQGTANLEIEMLPWSGMTQNYWLLGMGLVGLLSMLLALMGKLRPLFALYAVFIFGLAVWAVFLSPVRFDGVSGFQTALLFVFAAFLAVLGAIAQAIRPRN